MSKGIIRVTPRRAAEIPSHTLRGHKLKWRDAEMALPDLQPGDPARTADVKVKPGTNVKSFSPTGYDMADSSAGFHVWACKFTPEKSASVSTAS
jgi:hypothetical protein